MRKSVNLIIYFTLLVIGVYVLSSEAWGQLFSIKSGENGLLIRAALYFKDADTWAIIFMIITFGVGMSTFLLLSLFVDFASRKLTNKIPTLRFIMTSWGEQIFRIPLAFGLLLILFIITANVYIVFVGSQSTVKIVSSIRHPTPVIVLGTSKFLRSGNENLYYRYRIDAAIALHKHHKVSYFLLSGDGVGEEHTKKYDETNDMREDLLAVGVPEKNIKVDQFGFNTQNSILRLRGVFRLKEVVIVSQKFHSARALTLCKYYGIKAYAFNATGKPTFAMIRKEFLQSRPKLVMDILFANMQPREKSGADYSYRKEFSITESNRHVLIVMMVIVLAFIAPMGFGIFRAKKGPDRKRAALRYGLLTFGFSTALTALTLQVYKTTEIKFINELIETTAESFGIQTTKMQSRRPALTTTSVPLTITHELKQNAPLDEVAHAGSSHEKPFLSRDEHGPKTLEVFNESNPQTLPEADPFNTAESDTKSGNTAIPAILNFFKVVVHNSQTVVNDGVIRLRLAEPLEIGSTQFPINYVFECRTILFDGRVLIQASQIGSEQIDLRSYDGDTEGIRLHEKNLGRKDEIFLPEGEVIKIGYK